LLLSPLGKSLAFFNLLASHVACWFSWPTIPGYPPYPSVLTVILRPYSSCWPYYSTVSHIRGPYNSCWPPSCWPLSICGHSTVCHTATARSQQLLITQLLDLGLGPPAAVHHPIIYSLLFG
jgi:hypothetical protein